MITYIARRLVEVMVVLFAVTTMIFVLLHLTPGGPCNVVGSAQATSVPATANCIDYFQLDKPVVNQYLTFVNNYLHANLGTSVEQSASPVLTIILTKLPATILLITVAFTIQQIIALPLGMFAAVRRYSLFDGVFSVGSYVALSTPPFILGFALIYFVAVDLQWLPSGRDTDVTLPIFWTGPWFSMLFQNPALVLGDVARHLVLPAITLAVIGIALDSRFMRASMLQVLHEDYIRTAKAKGVGRRSIIFKHAFRNALPPIITNIALYLPALIGSAMVVEWVFSYTGIGYTFVQAIETGDTPVEQAVFLFSTVAVLLANLGADVAYALADPRVRYD